VSGNNWLEEWDAVVSMGEVEKIEELWLARLEEGAGDGSLLVEALRHLRAASKKNLAATLLELAAEQARGEGSWPARKLLLVELLRLGIGEADEWKAGLEECVRHEWADRPSLERFLREFSLRQARRPVDTLAQLETWLAYDIGGVFAMQGRGAGRVVEANPALAVLRLDFAREKHVPVPIDAAPKYLTPLSSGHFLRRRLEEPEVLAREVADDPPASLEAILESSGEALNVSEIKQFLADLLPEAQWTSWWNRARKLPRLLATGTGTRIRYRLAAAGGAEAEIRAQFAAADLAGRIELARRHASRSRELATEMAAALLADGAAADVAPGAAWEALQLAGRLGADGAAATAAQAELLGRLGPLPLLAAVSDAQQREQLLDRLQQERAAEWPALAATWLGQEVHPRVLSRIATALLEAGKGDRVVAFVDEVLLHPRRFPAAFVWVCEEDREGELTRLLDERRTGALLVRLVELAERREFGPFRARLKEVLSARGIAGAIVQDRLKPEHGKRLLQILERPGELADERNWLRRAVTARFPELRQEKKDLGIPALAATLDRLQGELRNILEKQIPETLKAIQVARAYGDLSENFEYHAARARQEFLSARAAQLQADLGRVRIVDPASVDASRVRVGTRVTLEGDGERRSLAVLGPYESDPEAGIVSNESEAGQALLGKGPGETLSLGGKIFRVITIDRLDGTKGREAK
jgi:transcription elongation GreA/GreB family factor